MTASPSSPVSPETPDAPRKKTPAWVAFVFLALLMGVFWVAQTLSRWGPSVTWLDNFDQALQKAQAENRRIFLLLQEPNCPTTDGHLRGLLTMNFARERLAKMVCCRHVLKPGDPLRVRFNFDREPLMLVLDKDGKEITRKTGAVTELEFKTYIHPEAPAAQLNSGAP